MHETLFSININDTLMEFGIIKYEIVWKHHIPEHRHH